jgi:hypothetical protein
MDGRVAGAEATVAGGAVVLGWFDGLPGEEVRKQPASTAKANRVTPQRMGRPPVEDSGDDKIIHPVDALCNKQHSTASA